MHASDPTVTRQPLEITTQRSGRGIDLPLEIAKCDEASSLEQQLENRLLSLRGVRRPRCGLLHVMLHFGRALVLDQTMPGPATAGRRSRALRGRHSLAR